VFLATELADEGVEGGCEYKAKTGHAHHAEQDRRTDGCAEDEKSRRAALLLLEREVGPFEGDAVRQNLVGDFLHATQGRAGGDARSGYALHLGGGKKIVARHPVRDGIERDSTTVSKCGQPLDSYG
jgi:hypothetical protein